MDSHGSSDLGCWRAGRGQFRHDSFLLVGEPRVIARLADAQFFSVPDDGPSCDAAAGGDLFSRFTTSGEFSDKFDAIFPVDIGEPGHGLPVSESVGTVAVLVRNFVCWAVQLPQSQESVVSGLLTPSGPADGVGAVVI